MAGYGRKRSVFSWRWCCNWVVRYVFFGSFLLLSVSGANCCLLSWVAAGWNRTSSWAFLLEEFSEVAEFEVVDESSMAAWFELDSWMSWRSDESANQCLLLVTDLAFFRLCDSSNLLSFNIVTTSSDEYSKK